MNIYKKTTEFIDKGIPIVVISVIEKHGEGPVEVGKKLLLSKTNQAFGTVGGGALEYRAREDAKELFRTKRSLTRTYLLDENQSVADAVSLPMACGGKVTLFFEYVGPSEYVYVFGGGHVGQALVNVLSTMNFHITVIDDRKEVIDAFIGGDEVIHQPFVDYILERGILQDSFVVVCTPSHEHDYDIIDTILKQKINVKYMGMLCSLSKLMDYLKKTKETHSIDVDLSNLYSPIGLDIGGGSPAEIAISIASEIIAVSNKKTGHLHMRERMKNDTYRYWENK